MTTTSPAPPTTSPLAIYRRLLTYTLAYRGVLVLSTLGMALYAASMASFSFLIKPMIDDAFVNPNARTIFWLPWIILGLFMLRGISGFLSTYGMNWIGRRVILRLRDEQFQQLLKLPVRFYDRVSSGHLIARLTYHVEQVAEAASTALTSVVQDGLMAVYLIGNLFYLNAELASFTLVVTPLIAGIISYVSRRFRKVSKRIQDNMSHVAQAAEESIAGQRIVKIHNGQQHEALRFGRINEQSRRLAMKLVVTKAGSEALIQFIAAWAVAAIVYFATQPERLSEISAGDFASFLTSIVMLMTPLRSLGNVNEKLQRGITAAGDLFELMEEESEPVGGTRELARANGEIEFRDVRFRYRSELTDALKGISVTIKPGQTVAFVGRSGSGKSTLLSLLPRFYDVDSGTLLLDGHDVREYPLDRLRAQIALVDQQVRLFDASVAENIAYGLDPLPPLERIVEAARAANALEFIEKLPQGFETRIGQNGGTLSGGQRQRLAIARALLKDAPILILDEATSALDTESERLIQSALDRLVVGRTTLVIAHRLSTVLNADLIVVMQDGAVVEQGRHEQLLQSNGLYASLYRMQFNEPATA